ncbi:MAG: Wzz/FepE/Etk N-terminal domain-containing protein [Candidatus Rehaiarchaeum fermentans]|nr:Wzz/FepE/Etk N-terminal domain-containing protein [Candidatus Rehaiarchaeum fermentans]
MSENYIAELFVSIWRRKFLILAVTIISILISFLINYFVLPPTFEGVAVLAPPVIFDQQNFKDIFVYNTTDFQSVLSSDSFIQALSNKLSIPFKDLKNAYLISVKPNENVFLIQFYYGDKKVIEYFFENFVNIANSFFVNEYNSIVASFKTNLEILQRQEDEINKRLEDVTNKINSFKGSSIDNIQYYLGYLALESIYKDLIQQKIQTEQQIGILKSSINASQPFSFKGGYKILDEPVKPRKIFNITVTGVTAFLAAVLIVIFVDYIKKIKYDF